MENWWAICAWCKKKMRRLDEGDWHDIDSSNLALANLENLSHGICPECEAQFRLSFNNKRNPNAEPDNIANRK